MDNMESYLVSVRDKKDMLDMIHGMDERSRAMLIVVSDKGDGHTTSCMKSLGFKDLATLGFYLDRVRCQWNSKVHGHG